MGILADSMRDIAPVDPTAPKDTLPIAFEKGLRSGMTGAGGQLHAITGLVAEAAGADEFAKARYSDAQRLSLRAQQEAPQMTSYKEVGGVGDALRYASGMVGQSVPYTATALGAAALAPAGLPSALAAGTLALTPFEAGDVAQRQMLDPAAMQETPQDRLKTALTTGVVSAGAQSLVPGMVAGKLLGRTATTAAKRTTGQILGRSAGDVALEGATEGAGEVIKQVGTNSDKAIDWDAVAENTVGGVAGGAPLGAAGAVGETLQGNKEKIKGFVGSAADRAGEAVKKGASFVGAKADGVAEVVGPEGLDLAGKAQGFVGRAKTAADDLKAKTEGIDLGEAAQGFVGRAKEAVDGLKTKAEGVDLGGAKEAAGDAMGSVASKLGDVFRRGKDEVNELVDRVANSEEFMNAKEFAGKQGDALKQAIQSDDDSRVAKAREWASEMWQSKVSPEQREQLRTAMADLSNKGNQAIVAGMKKAKDATEYGRAMASAFAEGVKARRAESQGAEGVKKSADYSGPDKIIREAVGPYLKDRGLLSDNESINAMAPALREVVSDMAAGKKVSVDTYLDLMAVAGEHTAGLLDTVHSALKVTDPKQAEQFFTEATQVAQVQKQRSKVLDLMESSQVDGVSKFSRRTMEQALSGLVQWAQTVPTGTSARQKFQNAQVKAEMERQFGSKAGAILNAVQTLVAKAESNKLEQSRVKVDDEGNPIGMEDDDEADFTDRLTEQDTPNGRFATYSSRMLLNAQDDPGKAGFKPAITQALERAAGKSQGRARYVSAEELGADHPLYKAKRNELVKEGLARDLSMEEAKRYADGEIGKFGVPGHEVSDTALDMTADEIYSLRLDTKAYGRSPARVDADIDGMAAIDAVKLTREMRKRSAKGNDLDKGQGSAHDARMFVEGLAALETYSGKTIDVDPNTVINERGLTWGKAQKYLRGPKKVRGDDKLEVAVEQAIGDMTDRELLQAQRRLEVRQEGDPSPAVERSLEAIAKELDRRHSDPTGFSPQASNKPARDPRLDVLADMRAVLEEMDKDSPQFAALKKKVDELDMLITTEGPLGSGRTKIDPFGPTQDTLRGRLIGDPIRINSDGSAREDTVMGRRRPAKSVEAEGSPDPKAVAAKKAAFLEKARSGDEALIETLKTSNDAKGLQRAVEALLAEPKSEGVTKTLDAINERLGQLIMDPDVAYGMGIKKYSLMRYERGGFDVANVGRLVPSQREDGRWRLVNPESGEAMSLGDEFQEKGVSSDDYDLDSTYSSEARARAALQQAHDANTAYAYSMQRVDPNATGPRDVQAAMDYLRRVLGNTVQVVPNSPILHAGEFEEVITAGGIDDVIRMSVHSLDPLSVAHHEALHAFFAKLGRQGNGDVIQVVEKAASSPMVMGQLRTLLAGHPDALAQLSNREERAAYMYQFWAAGQLKLNTEATTFFQKIAEYVRSILGVWSNDQRALRTLEFFHQGGFAKNGNRDAVAAALMEPGRNKRLETFKQMIEPLTNLGEALAVAGHQRLRDTEVPALIELADILKLSTTGEGNDQGFVPAARQERSRRMNDLGEALAGMDADALQAAMESMQLGNANAPIDALPSAEQRIDARNARKVLRETLDGLHEYMSEAGVEVRDLGVGTDYFPRIWDASYISSHQSEFLGMLESYVRSGEFKGDPRETMHRLMTTDGAEMTIVVNRPGMQQLKPRVLKFITHADAAPFLNKNLYETMNRYITQATRRAEWARRLGDKSEKVTSLLSEAAAQGATQDDVETARKYIYAIDGTLGDGINPEWRRLQGNLIVYQNIRLLPLAIFSSIVDPMGIVVRGGTVGDAFSALKRGVRNVVKNFKTAPETDEAEALAATLGTIDSVMLAHTLGTSFNQGMVGDRARKINDWFFRMNLMEQFNTDMRVGATQAAIGFIKTHRTGTKSAHSMRWLAELGLTPADIHLNAAGDVVLSEAEGLSPEAALKMRTAINRWVDGAVLRPDAADKPLWMSDPHYAILAHLKQFVFAFHETILKRVAHEVRAGNYTPAYALASYVPVMIAADAAKGILQGGGSEPAWKRDWTAADYLWSGVERGGLLGVGQFAADAVHEVNRGGTGLGHLAGPTIEQLADAVQVIAGNGRFAPFALKAMPANALYAPILREAPSESPHPL